MNRNCDTVTHGLKLTLYCLSVHSDWRSHRNNRECGFNQWTDPHYWHGVGSREESQWGAAGAACTEARVLPVQELPCRMYIIRLPFYSPKLYFWTEHSDEQPQLYQCLNKVLHKNMCDSVCSHIWGKCLSLSAPSQHHNLTAEIEQASAYTVFAPTDGAVLEYLKNTASDTMVPQTIV